MHMTETMRNVNHRWQETQGSAPVCKSLMQLAKEILSTSDYATEEVWRAAGSDCCLAAVGRQQGVYRDIQHLDF
jgi:hypothetical protein